MYAIVCSSKAKALWPNALEALRLKHSTRWLGKVHVVAYDGKAGVQSCLAELSTVQPSFCCFLTHHSECSKEYIQEVNRLTRRIDLSSPYCDVIWGVLTGLVESDVLFAIKQESLTIGRVVGNCPIDLSIWSVVF